MNAKLLMIHAWTPLHAGTGQSLGAIDLAIAREASTGIPFIPGSSIKGVLRDLMSDAPEECIKVFGPEPGNGSDCAGSLHFGDARLVCMPMRSFAGTFGYVTSPYLLQRLDRDMREAGLKAELPTMPDSLDAIKVSEDSLLVIQDKVVFEDLDFKSSAAGDVTQYAQVLAKLIFKNVADQESFVRRFAIVHDDAMSYAMEHATEVRARISIDDATKTVKKGALWYEESLPAESILSALTVAAPPARVRLSPAEVFDSVGEILDGLVQLGGKATVGRGQCSLRFAGE